MKLKRNSLGFAPILIIIIVTFVLIAGAFVANKYQINISPKETPTPTSTLDPTANWKIYKNTKYNYQIRYPSEFRVVYSLDPKIVYLNSSSKGGNVDIQIDSVNLTYKITSPVETWIKKLYPDKTFSKTTLSEKLAYAVITYDNTYGNTVLYIIPYNKTFYTISVSMVFNLQESRDKIESLTKEIISTFKFLNPEPTPTCVPRPACLDSVPPCLMPVDINMCPPKN